MSKVKNFIKRHKVLTVLLVVVVIVSIIAVSCVSKINSALAEVTNVQPNVTTLSIGSLENIVTATGTLESTNIRQVTTTQTAEVEEIYVQVGDTVQAGDLLAVLDAASLEKQVGQAQEDANTAQATDGLGYRSANRQLAEAQESYDSTLSSDDKAVKNAKNALNDLIALAEQTAEGQSNREALRNRRDELHDVWKAAAESYGDYSEQASEAWVPFDEAYQAAEAAEKLYDSAYSQFSDQIAAAQNTYDMAVSQRDANIRMNESAVKSAQEALERQGLTDSAKTYERQVDSLLDQQDEMSIYAPISGTVTAINAEVGVSAAGFSAAATGTGGLSSGLFEIQDTASMQIVTSVAEYDVVQIEKGMQVSITSDAQAGHHWDGIVSSVSPTAIDAQANFEVIITVTSDPGVLTPGMSARMNIIVEQVENAYAVPFDAVVFTEEGAQVVYAYTVGENGEAVQEPIPVETGLESDYYVQIISSQLEDGMQILNDPLGVNVNQEFNMFGI